jgi:hypothetical protein
MLHRVLMWNLMRLRIQLAGMNASGRSGDAAHHREGGRGGRRNARRTTWEDRIISYRIVRDNICMLCTYLSRDVRDGERRPDASAVARAAVVAVVAFDVAAMRR